MLRIGSLALFFAAPACHNTESPKSEAVVPLTASAAAVSSPAPSAALPVPVAPTTSDAPPDATAPANGNVLEEEFRAFVASRQACTAASDCTNVTGSCPFGCTIPVAKSAESAVKNKLDELVQRKLEQGPRCVYRCAAPAPPACVSGRCTVP